MALVRTLDEADTFVEKFGAARKLSKTDEGFDELFARVLTADSGVDFETRYASLLAMGQANSLDFDVVVKTGMPLWSDSPYSERIRPIGVRVCAEVLGQYYDGLLMVIGGCYHRTSDPNLKTEIVGILASYSGQSPDAVRRALETADPGNPLTAADALIKKVPRYESVLWPPGPGAETVGGRKTGQVQLGSD
jgi:hypothetical protein